MSLPKRQKQLLSRSIVHAVRSQNPPGRFLQRDPQSDLWYDVGDARATEKTSQALREGAPKLRDKMKIGEEENTLGAEHKAAASAKPAKKAPPETPPIIVHPPPTAKTVVPPQPNGVVGEESRQHNYPPRAASQYHHHHQEEDVGTIPPPPTPLDPVGDFSFGTISVPDAPDMGLENGFSFGSVMSVDPQQRQSTTAARSSVSSVPGMPTGLQGQEFSFGSIAMSEAEQRRVEANLRGSFANNNNNNSGHHPARIDERHEAPAPQPVDFGLEHGGLSAGSMMSVGTIQTLAGMDPSAPQRKAQMVSFGSNSIVPPQPYQQQQQKDNGQHEEPAPQPVDYGLEPGGLSTGSMMSIGTLKLEDVGTSFGSVMSFTTPSGDVPDAVDGGLEHIGTSFGSMTLGAPPAPAPPAPVAGQESFQPPEPLAAAEPTLLFQQRSRGNLLDCSDSESEDEAQSAQASLQKSAEWEKLKATFEAQMQAGMYPSADQPPSLYGMNGGSRGQAQQASQDDSRVILPGPMGRSTTDDSNNNMPPPAARTGDDEWKAFEASLLNRGNSLAGDDFDVPRQTE